MTAPQYIALIGDFVASRRLSPESRHALQERLSHRFGQVQAEDREGFAAWPLVTIGDEFQALFTAGGNGHAALLAFIEEIVELARPAAVRFGLGIGPLSTALRDEALGMDGPCFHLARSALESTRALELPCQLRTSAGESRLWSALASYALRRRQSWTAAQSEAIRRFEVLRSWKQVAAELGISPSAVSLRQKAAGYSLYSRALKILEQELAILRGDG